MSPTPPTPRNIENATDPLEALSYGWVSSGKDRGTDDIIWNSILTMLLCTWVSVYPNIPSPNAKWYHRFFEKVWLALVGLLGPDFLFAIALGQLSSAKRSVKIFRNDPALCGGMKWTYEHGFFLDMGGIHLTSPDYPDGFPINAEQLYYLVKHKHVDFPDMAKMHISERNTQDTLSRFIAVWQVFWFVVIEIQRLKVGLPMTTLELTALSFAFVMVGTSACWFYKPFITRRRCIPTRNNATVESIRQYAKHNTHKQLPDGWYRTPLDFISRRPFMIDCHWAYLRRMSELIRISIPGVDRFLSPPARARPWDHYPSDEYLPICMDAPIILFGSVTLILFSVSLMPSWNFYFSTDVERILWRAMIVYQCCFGISGGTWFLCETIKWHRDLRNETTLNRGQCTTRWSRDERSSACHVPASTSPETDPQAVSDEEAQRFKRLSRGILVRIRELLWSWDNISVDKDPTNAIPLHINLVVIMVCFVYSLCRLWMYVEDYMALRCQPGGVYITVNRFLPFLW